MTLSSKERAELRGHAHHLPVMVHIGHDGITDAIRQTLDDALRTKELVKVQFSKNADVKAKNAANDLAREVNADAVQTIGRTATFFRENPEIKKKAYLHPPE
jgi:RNA-binding protein